MNTPVPSLIVSLHDVAAVHLPRLRKAESLLRSLKVDQVQYLFVPEFHGRYRASEYPEFLDWCRRERSFKVSWWLHGYYHQDRPVSPEPEVELNFAERMKRRFLTAGEGEFLTLNAAAQRRRLQAGMEEFSHCLQGIKPAGFVPPAWLFKPDVLLPVLREMNLPFTEDHHLIYDVNHGRSRPAPVITWATRTLLRKYGSLVLAPIRTLLLRKSSVVRLAMHPHDFDHPLVVRNIETVLRTLKRDRAFTLPEKLDWSD